MNLLAASAIFRLPDSVLASVGSGIPNILALRQAQAVTKVACNLLFGSNGISVGGRFGNDQNGLPSLVFASKGYVYINCLISFMKYF